ncbi:hypothetical protein PHISCL_06399, partial [Aspergillus sclerotialis]
VPGGGAGVPSSSVPGGGAGASPSPSIGPSVPGGGGVAPSPSPGPSGVPSGPGGGGAGTSVVPVSSAPSPSVPGGGAGGVTTPAPGHSSVPGGGAVTVRTTQVITTCPGGGPSGVPSGPGGGAGPSGVPSGPGGGAGPSGTPSSPGGGAAPSGTAGPSCPTDLSGDYEYPHLIIPIDSSAPSKAAGTSFNGTVTDTVSTIFNFDIPNSDAGKTCSLVFLFPHLQDLETSSYSFSGDGKVDFALLDSVATQSTSYDNAPGIKQDLGQFTISPGNSYLVSTFKCPAGQAVSYEMKNQGSTNLDFFEDYNPSPLGLYITVC